MAFSWKLFADIAAQFAPLILPLINPALAPVASIVGHAIGEAEAIPGATGAQKLQHVQNIVNTVAPTIPGVNAQEVSTALQDGINAVVAATNVVAKSAPAASSTVTPKAS